MDNKKEYASTTYEKLLSNINSWSDKKHPILYELISIMGRYYVMHEQDSNKGLEYL